MSLRAVHPDFLSLFPDGAQPRQLASGLSWAEGPTYVPARRAVIFSDVRQNRTWRYTDAGALETELEPSDHQNGHCVDLQGRLVACSGTRRGLLRQEHSGEWTLLADRFEGMRLNSPNDVALCPDGSLWFSDPTYGLDNPLEGSGGQQELPGRWVFRVDPDGTLTAPIRDRTKPNGLAFVDAHTLLLADTGDAAVYRYDVTQGGAATLRGEAFRVSPGKTDGLRIDEAGRIWSSAADGVHVLTPDGQELGRVLLPELCSNLCFGGPDFTTLYMTASTTFWTIETRVRGRQFPDGGAGAPEGLALA